MTSGQPPGTEPDYRMSLAAERTYLAHIRTGLALIAGGVAAAGAFPDAGAQGLRRGLGIALVVLGALVLGTARTRWKAIDRAMRLGEPMPQSVVVNSLSWLLLAVAVVAVVIVLLL